jgi:hypothetical protein
MNLSTHNLRRLSRLNALISPAFWDFFILCIAIKFTMLRGQARFPSSGLLLRKKTGLNYSGYNYYVATVALEEEA